ncbi:regulatory protein MerR [Segniliparus rotundus DSM 44985]|uniref:Regulatory protein MerR n=1 Tax=Segniliparus rotundus (strain ATCC BAA-972 / CDC 1076 / CIP 108378 / DSM 44985 / JCM 13578) TaxID=640132 RepID=D6ZD53_SEGRD|nr:helix-turn-helix domain-containing protein [Segniliparus rotundus]ADG99240.1 regulatory protein MerR [Segniliparus rotundus DSM 44985]
MPIGKIGATDTAHEFDEILSAKEAAKLLGLTPGTLRYYRHKGRGPKSFICGRLTKYRKSELIAWLQAQEAASSKGGIIA